MFFILCIYMPPRWGLLNFIYPLLLIFRLSEAVAYIQTAILIEHNTVVYYQITA